MNDSKPPTFWQTLPGMLTALAGVITAVARTLTLRITHMEEVGDIPLHVN
jgi:hypothetical protein